MFRFKSFISLYEAKSKALSSEVSNDDKGKLHELLLSKHLHPEGKLPEHHRSHSVNSEHAGTPEQVHNKLKTKIGEAAYNEINHHAKNTAAALITHMKNSGNLKSHEKIADVHWTSNRDTAKKAGDHQKTTGERDPNSNADLILTKKDKSGKVTGYHGVSAKYGTNKQPNYKNPGLASMENDSHHSAGKFTGIMVAHAKRMEKLGYTGSIKERHAQHKNDKEAIKAGDKKAASRVEAAEASSLKARTEIAHKYASGLKRKSPEQTDLYLKHHIRTSVSPKTIIPHSIAHSHVQADGSSKPIIHNAAHVADDHLDNYHSLDVTHSGISANITGVHKTTGKRRTIATIGVKASSGPHKGANGTVSLK